MGRTDLPEEQADSPADADDTADNAHHDADADDTAPADSPAAADGTEEDAEDAEDGDGHAGRRGLRRMIGGLNRLLGRITPPAPDPDFPETPTKSVRVSVLSATLCLGVSALLVSGKIVEIADRLPLGPERDRWLAAATEVDRVGSRLGLDRPYDLLRDLRGAGDEAGQQIDVIGDVQDLLDLASAPDPLGSPDGRPEAPGPADATADAGIGESGSVDDRDAAATPVGRDDDTGSADGDDAQTAEGDDLGPTGEAAGEDVGSEHDSTDRAVGAPPGSTDEAPGDGRHHLDPSRSPAEARTPEEPEEEHAPGPLRALPVSAEAPLRTYVAGDSQAFHLGHALQASPLSEVMDITVDQRHSTGLARPSYFNWPVHMFFVAVGGDPELLVMTLGSNDWQAMSSEDGQRLPRGSEEWSAEWGRRLSVMLDALNAPHRQIVWVGLPPTRADDFREGYALMNGIVAGIAAERDFVTLIDIWEMFGGDAAYRESVQPPGDPDGTPVDVRDADGVHVNRRGAEWVVDIIEEEIRRVWDPPAG